jgi:hypothetical protein
VILLGPNYAPNIAREVAHDNRLSGIEINPDIRTESDAVLRALDVFVALNPEWTVARVTVKGVWRGWTATKRDGDGRGVVQLAGDTAAGLLWMLEHGRGVCWS